MAKSIGFDDRGFQRMISHMARKNAESFRDTTRNRLLKPVVVKTAKDTRSAHSNRRKAIEDVRRRILQYPYRTRTGDRIGLTSEGKAWFQGRGWAKDRWILVSEGGLRQPRRTVNRTSGGAKTGARARISSRLRAEIVDAVREVKAFVRKEEKYVRERVGSAKASWHILLRKLNIPHKIAKLPRVIDPALRRANRTAEIGRGDRYTVEIRSKSEATLNPKAGGIRYFKRRFRNQKRFFEMSLEKDLERHARKQAKKQGFRLL